ncbi:MAG: membrane protein insertase YidC [Bacteroidales bacterium]|nr:membrane protein insertase YidC [Bacteroidales bacterium]
MDKNTIIGLVIISVLLIGYMFISRPSQEEIAERQRVQDSIAHEQMVKEEEAKAAAELLKAEVERAEKDSVEMAESLTPEQIDSIKTANLRNKYGMFAKSVNGENKFTVIENNKMIITFLNRGGKIYSVELKDYKTFDQNPLVLFENGDNSVFGIELSVKGKPLVTNDMYFEPMLGDNKTITGDTIKVGENDLNFIMRLTAETGKYVEYNYIIHPDDYMLDFNLNFVGLKDELKGNTNARMQWSVNVFALERGRDWESNNTTVFMRMSDEEIENLGEMKDADDYKTKGNAQWIAYKQQFFSSILVSKDKTMEDPSIALVKLDENEHPEALKNFSSEFYVEIPEEQKVSKEFSFYFGPNKYSLLKEYTDKDGNDMDMEKVIPLGWGIFGWVNKYAIIPMFNLLGRGISNYGIIILLMTIIIKLVLFPLTYKSYMSTAKMRVLKPQIDALSEKYPKGKEMERQQAQMSLYQKAGVSPMGGCLPLLLQFPILIAMFRFFPASIELRQQSFLWASDLSSYDAILEWSTNIPIISTFYGNHVSLFALLMAISMFVQQMMTSSQNPSNSMPGMKVMMYMMPVLMLLWFNKYSSGLSYYYLLANLFSILQTWIIQRFVVNEEKLLAQMEANKAKPKKKSKWLQKLEEATRKQQEEMKKNQKR